jgi:hypothetical protein
MLVRYLLLIILKGDNRMKKGYCTVRIILILFVLLLIFPIIVSANINTIIQQMERSYQKQISGIQDLTIVQEMKGGFFNIKTITYYKKAKVNNQEVFKSRMETSIMGMDTVNIYDGQYSWSIDPATGEVEMEEGGVDSLQVWKMFRPEKTSYLGDERIDGKDAYKIQLDDALWMAGMEGVAGSDMPEDAEIEMQGIYWIDKENLVPLKSQNLTKTTSTEDGETVVMDIITDVDFQDYRPIGSMLISHKMLVSTKYEFDDTSIESFEEDEEDFSEEFSGMLESIGKMEIVVTNTEINTGLPDELFDGTLLEAQEPMFGGTPESSQDVPASGDIGETMSQEDIEAMMEGFMEMMEGNEDFQEMMKEMKPAD